MFGGFGSNFWMEEDGFGARADAEMGAKTIVLRSQMVFWKAGWRNHIGDTETLYKQLFCIITVGLFLPGFALKSPTCFQHLEASMSPSFPGTALSVGPSPWPLLFCTLGCNRGYSV